MSGEYRGNVEQWHDDKWGFIKADDPQVGRTFVHRSALKNCRTLEVGDRVSFGIVSDLVNPGKVKAADVVLLPPI